MKSEEWGGARGEEGKALIQSHPGKNTAEEGNKREQ